MLAGGERLADDATQPEDLAVERDPVRLLGKQLLGHSLDIRFLFAGNHPSLLQTHR